MPTQAEIAKHLGIRERGVRELRDNGVIPDGRRATLDEIRQAYLSHLREIAAGRQQGQGGRGQNGRRSTPGEVLRDINLVLPREHLIPWAHDQIFDFPDYEKEAGIEEGGAFDLLCYGLPILPPARGKKVARVSWPHAERWRVLVAVLVFHLTGNQPDLSRLGQELHRFRGVG